MKFAVFLSGFLVAITVNVITGSPVPANSSATEKGVMRLIQCMNYLIPPPTLPHPSLAPSPTPERNFSNFNISLLEKLVIDTSAKRSVSCDNCPVPLSQKIIGVLDIITIIFGGLYLYSFFLSECRVRLEDASQRSCNVGNADV